LVYNFLINIIEIHLTSKCWWCFWRS